VAPSSAVVQTGSGRGRAALALANRSSAAGRPAAAASSVSGRAGQRAGDGVPPVRATVSTVRNAGGGAVNEIQPRRRAHAMLL